jgi:hypothetical protein
MSTVRKTGSEILFTGLTKNVFGPKFKKKK